MCVWNVTSGQCIENTKLPYRHTAIHVSIATFHGLSLFITRAVLLYQCDIFQKHTILSVQLKRYLVGENGCNVSSSISVTFPFLTFS